MSLDCVHRWKELNKDFAFPLQLTMETAGGQAAPGKQHSAGCTLLTPRVAPARPGGQPATPVRGKVEAFLPVGCFCWVFACLGKGRELGRGSQR